MRPRLARDNAFTPRRVSLCWGDSRLPNMMFRDDRVAAVLDWEMAFLGDPEADLGWWCFLDWANNEGYGGPHLDGIPGKEETLARYAELTGHPVEHAHWHEVFAAFRYGVILGRVAHPHACDRRVAPVGRLGVEQRLHPGAGAAARPAAARRGALTTRVGRREAGAPVRLQFRLSGQGGGDWWVLVHGDDASRHAGVVDDPDATLEADVADWRVSRRELDRLQAFMDGKLKISGDLPSSCCTRR